MRPKVLLAALLAAGAVIGLAVWLNDASRAPAILTPAAETVPAPLQPLAPISNQNQPRLTLSPAPPRHDIIPPPDGSDSVDAILADLEKPDWKVRQSALQRARDLDDRSIVPRLQQIANLDNDPREQADILDTINYLNLPDISENMAAAAAARAAAGQPNPPQSPTNRWTGQPFQRPQ